MEKQHAVLMVKCHAMTHFRELFQDITKLCYVHEFLTHETTPEIMSKFYAYRV
jgi:hypothetical protein